MQTWIVIALNVISAVAAFIAAFYWYRSTVVMAPFEPEAHKGEPSYGSMVLEASDGKLYDGAGTDALRTKANRVAALSAGVAALFQGISMLLQAVAV